MHQQHHLSYVWMQGRGFFECMTDSCLHLSCLNVPWTLGANCPHTEDNFAGVTFSALRSEHMLQVTPSWQWSIPLHVILIFMCGKSYRVSICPVLVWQNDRLSKSSDVGRLKSRRWYSPTRISTRRTLNFRLYLAVCSILSLIPPLLCTNHMRLGKKKILRDFWASVCSNGPIFS